MKRIIVLLLAMFMIITTVAGCGSSSADADNSDSPSTTNTVDVSEADENGLQMPIGEAEVTDITIWSAADYQMGAQLAVAQAKGYFAEQGLNVELNWVQNAADIPTMMIAGDISVASGSWGNVMSVDSFGVDAELLSFWGDASATLSVIASEDSGITKFEDIVGHKIGWVSASTTIRILQNLCDAKDVDFDSLDLVNMYPSDSLAAFMNGDIDVVYTWHPYVAQAIMAGGTELINGAYDFATGEELTDIYPNGYCLYASEEFTDENPIATAKLMYALAKAQIDLEDPDKIEGLAEETYETMGLASPEYAVINLNAMKYTMEMTQEQGDAMMSEVPFYVELGAITEDVDISIINTEFLEMVAPEWVHQAY